MKINLKWFLFALLIIPAFFLVKQVVAQAGLPRISTACESNNGRLYVANDGFSNKKECAKKDRLVMLTGGYGLSGWERLNAMTDNDTNYRKRVTVLCTGNKKVIGGGVNISNGDDRRTFISQSYPDTDHSWTVGAEETTIDGARSISGIPWTLEAFVICTDVN